MVTAESLGTLPAKCQSLAFLPYLQDFQIFRCPFESRKVTESQGELIPYEDLMGSVRTALSVLPGFHQYHFNDLNPCHISELDQIKREYPGKDIRISQQDANQFIPTFCGSLGSTDRAVLLNPPGDWQIEPQNI